MDKYQAQTDSQTSEVVGSTVGLSGSTQYNEYEDAGEDDLSQQSAEHRYVSLQVVGTRSLQSRNIGCQHIQQGTANECKLTATPQPINTSTIVPTISAKYFFIAFIVLVINKMCYNWTQI